MSDGMLEPNWRVRAKVAETQLAELARLAKAHIDSMPKCTQCPRIATRAFKRGSERFCDEHGTNILLERGCPNAGEDDVYGDIPEYPRAAPLCALLATLDGAAGGEASAATRRDRALTDCFALYMRNDPDGDARTFLDWVNDEVESGDLQRSLGEASADEKARIAVWIEETFIQCNALDDHAHNVAVEIRDYVLGKSSG